jgi:hypothetical protein
MAQITLQPHFSNAQLELLRLFKEDLSDAQLRDLRLLLSNFMLQQVLKAAEKATELKGYDQDFLATIVCGDSNI